MLNRSQKSHVADTVIFGCSTLTGVQQIGVFVAQNFVGQEIVSVSIEGQKWHHVVTVVVADGGIGSRVGAPDRLMGPEPSLKNTVEVE